MSRYFIAISDISHLFIYKFLFCHFFCSILNIIHPPHPFHRNPKPDQLEKIATALGLNVSVFLDFNIETVGDVLSLLFSIDDSVNLSLSEAPDQKVSLTFDNPTMQDFFRKWCQFKNVYEKEKAEILAIEDDDKRQEELDKLNATQEEWKLRAMGTTIGCHTIVKKGTEGNDIKTYDLT